MSQITLNANLAPYHTFGIDCQAKVLVKANSVAELISIYQNDDWQYLPKLPLGSGSNMLFTSDFEGVVVLNRLKGISVTEDGDFWYLECESGEDWPDLVEWSVKQGLHGLENLALIPGCIGTAPIQNIGAYGVEFKDVCDYVEYLDLTTLQVVRLSMDECQFGYRDSIFKKGLYGNALIIKVGLKLAKSWQAKFQYGALQNLITGEPTSVKIFEAVKETRQSKLPNPEVEGNAGSFFKNPVITKDLYKALKAKHPSLVAFEAPEGFKVAAGWLIDNAGLKGYQVGGARVHDNQALVIVNKGGATAQDVIQVARHVQQTVKQRYSVELEHEVRFIGRTQETCLHDVAMGL
ncbi:UDP-N-acetylmuramate dehydrogenase [Vibrio gallicus]|uniref:UDP-N-acetylmuramate dehydrogenase n=1 Tax=Vibrio gallicus TaxID=190897 RepID=UPI0021C48ABE|nr:UDP-N-acetylmuramate dehydrogenase [Vibrio gallicus]